LRQRRTGVRDTLSEPSIGRVVRHDSLPLQLRAGSSS
jgi:hypothetical protein